MKGIAITVRLVSWKKEKKLTIDGNNASNWNRDCVRSNGGKFAFVKVDKMEISFSTIDKIKEKYGNR